MIIYFLAYKCYFFFRCFLYMMCANHFSPFFSFLQKSHWPTKRGICPSKEALPRKESLTTKETFVHIVGVQSGGPSKCSPPLSASYDSDPEWQVWLAAARCHTRVPAGSDTPWWHLVLCLVCSWHTSTPVTYQARSWRAKILSFSFFFIQVYEFFLHVN